MLAPFRRSRDLPKTIFYVAGGTVWAVPADDGEPRMIRGGNSVAVDPRGQYLIIQVNETAGVRLVRLPIDGGAEETVRVPPSVRLAASFSLGANAINRDGRIAVRLAPTDSWFWPAAILDQATGRVERIPGGDQADMMLPGWASDGSLVTYAALLSGNLWRFRPESEAR